MAAFLKPTARCKAGTVDSPLVAAPLRAMSGFLRELRAAREARIERRARSRVTSALDAAVDAASTLRLADTEADDGSARTTSTASGPSVDDFPPDLLPSSVRRRRRNGDLLSDDALRRIVDRIHAQHVEEQDANARLQAAIRGLTSEEFAALPDDTWPRVKPDDAKPNDAHTSGTPDECAVCYVGFEDGDELKVLPCGHAQFHLGCIRTWLERSPTCPLCRCACRPPRVNLLKPILDDTDAPNHRGIPAQVQAPPPGSGTSTIPEPEVSTDEMRRTLERLEREHEEESAWLDSLEAQPRFVPTPVTGTDAVPEGDQLDDTTSTDAEDAAYRASVRERARRYFDPLDTEYMRRNYGELYQLREEEREIRARLETLSAHEDDLRTRLADAREAQAMQRSRVGEEAASVGAARWLRNDEVDATRATASRGTRGAPAAALEQVAAERTRASVVNAMDALARWRNRDE